MPSSKPQGQSGKKHCKQLFFCRHVQCLYSAGKYHRLILLSLWNIVSRNVTYTTIWFLHMGRLQLMLQSTICPWLLWLSISKLTRLQRVYVTISITTSVFNYWLCWGKPVCNIGSEAEWRRNTYAENVAKMLWYSTGFFFLGPRSLTIPEKLIMF